MVGPVSAPRPSGLSESDPAALGAQVLAASDGFLAVARGADLSRPSRLPGWTGRDTCIHLGSWDDARVMESLLESARTGAFESAGNPDETNALLVQAHRAAADHEVVAALVAARNGVERFFAEDAAQEGRLLARSALGPLPLLSLVHAGTYELAVHALDLAPCGAPPPPAQLLDRGVAALIDVTGALSARAGIDITLTAMTDAGGWRFSSDVDGWTTEQARAGAFTGVGVRGSAADLLDAAAGRVGLPQLLLSRRLHVQHLPQWMRLAPLLEDAPGLPGGATLRGAVAGLSGVAGGVGRVLGRLRR